MSHLLVDIGNTRIKMAIATGDECHHLLPIFHQQQTSEQILSAMPQERFEGVWIANVAPLKLCTTISRWANHKDLSCYSANSQTQFRRLKNGYLNPRQLGVDRWLGMIACEAENLGPSVLISAGTALTIDIIDPNYQHLGGYILPGLGLNRIIPALNNQDIAPSFDGEGFPQNTQQAVNAACQEALLPGLASFFGKISKKIDFSFKWVITGGDAAKLPPVLPNSDYVKLDNAVLLGLNTIRKSDIEQRGCSSF
ncbi:MAG: hypothetical protein CMF48_03830 [Legionellales bacterium]|nr:hypothetical protein [Legionellales bacterium]|tara:strand:+ start:94 stop:852 length:759 start_codon:yes stop_codon:yes gene_type:complete